MKRLVTTLGAGTLALMLSIGARAEGDPAVDAASIAAAKTAAEHEAIARDYEAEAAIAKGRVTAHESMARIYRLGGTPKASHTARTARIRHCDRLVKQYRSTAEENIELAALHRQMAAR